MNATPIGPVMMLSAAALGVVAAGAADYEVPPTVAVTNVLSAELVQGEHYRVSNQVRSDGYLNYFTIESDYGEFEAVGRVMLQERIREVGALAELDELSKSKVFVDAAAQAGKDQVLALTRVATNPVSTVKGIPGGIGRMFKRTSRQVRETTGAVKEEITSDDEESGAHADADGGESKAAGLTESYFGVSKAERNWAQKLGTDPYTSNEILREAIKSVAWAERLGRFTTKLAPSIPGASVAGDVNDMVWSKDPYELQDLNRQRLQATGAADELIDAYLDHGILSPTQQTLLTGAIAAMENVPGRAGVLSRALETQTEVEARFFVHSVMLLASYHAQRQRFSLIASETPIPFGVVDDKQKVLAFAVDELYWIDSVAESAGVYDEARGDGVEAKVVYFLGGVSERCRAELERLGWEVLENVKFDPDTA